VICNESSAALCRARTKSYDNVLLRPQNILVFRSKGDYDKATPITSHHITGFDYSRPDRLTEKSLEYLASTLPEINLYRHPQCPWRSSGQNPFRRQHDIYSLRVVLLEIGLWRRIQTHYYTTNSTEKFQDLLIDTCLNELGPRTGNKYRDVIVRCLRGDLGADLRDDLSEEEPKA
jgi:hypothetical protein